MSSASSSQPAASPAARAGGPRPAHREFGTALAVGALGAGVALLGTRESWARVYFPAQNPLPASAVSLNGQDLAPAVAALAIAGLACLAAVIATRGVLRRITGLLLAAFGAGTMAAAAVSARVGHIAAVAADHAPTPYGAGTSAQPAAGLPRPQLAMAAFPWWVVALAGGLLLVAAGALTLWRGARWPGMSSRYERPGGASGPGGARGASGTGGAPGARDPGTGGPRAGADRDSAAVWEALDRGSDPTV